MNREQMELTDEEIGNAKAGAERLSWTHKPHPSFEKEKYLLNIQIDKCLSLLNSEELREKPLFQLGDFTLHSGDKSNWKIDCDALTNKDWVTLASMIYDGVPHFRKVIGIPRGGLTLAWKLKRYCFPNPEYPVLIVDDVLTTGASFEKMKATLKEDCIGAVVFARGKCPDWVTPLSLFPPLLNKKEEKSES